MADLIARARNATRESRQIEFKVSFDPSSSADFCEVVKDIVAIANSGGGIIVFGLDDCGTPNGAGILGNAPIDPADVANRISKYTGPADLDFEIVEIEKGGQKLEAFVVQGAPIPIVFHKPGTYDIGGGRQKTAFSAGTVYFRHGAKSEPGTTVDVRSSFERHLEGMRKSWMSGVRKIVRAPRGAEIVAVSPKRAGGVPFSFPSRIRAVRDRDAVPVLLTRDPTKATSLFVHERISEGIFDEINNVVEANRALAMGQRHFFFGPGIYYRIYAERQYVTSREDDDALLFESAVCDLYAPALFWVLRLPDKLVAATLAKLYRKPTSPHIHFLAKTAVILGPGFCDFLLRRFDVKWGGYSQPPSFYFSFHDLVKYAPESDYRLIAAKMGSNAVVEIPDQPVAAAESLLKDPAKASQLLSHACLNVFKANSGDRRSLCRSLDFFAYGAEIRSRAAGIGEAFANEVGDEQPGEVPSSAHAASEL